MAGSEGLIFWGILAASILYLLFLTLSLSSLSGRVDSLGEMVRINSEKLDTFSGSYTRLEDNLNALEGEIKSLSVENSKALKTLSSRLNEMEKGFSNLQGILKSLEESVESVKGNVSGMNLKMVGFQSQISEMEKEILDLEEGLRSQKEGSLNFEKRLKVVERLSERVNPLGKRIDDLEKELNEKILSVSANVNRLESSLSEMKREIRSVIRLSEISKVDPVYAPFVKVEIQRGDTVSEIAMAYGVDVEVVMGMNGIINPESLKVGQKLKIPVSLKDVIVLPVERLKKGTVEKGIDESGWVRFKTSGYVRAVMPGRVEEVKSGYVRIYHGNGVETSYRFHGDIFVKEGNWVKSGQRIGTCAGELDFALMINGEPRDPFKYIFNKIGDFSATFYTEWEDGILPEQASFRVTKSGEIVERWWTVAADPSVIPLGSFVYIPQLSRKPGGGVFKVEDIGSAIKGRRIDVYVGDMLEAIRLWKKDVTLYVLHKGG